MPKQVRFRCVHLTSYGFLQTLPLASNALAIRITFPLVWVVQVSCNLTGLPASLGKQKNRALGSVFLELQYCLLCDFYFTSNRTVNQFNISHRSVIASTEAAF